MQAAVIHQEKGKEDIMKTQTRFVVTVSVDPQAMETTLQERSCTPAPDPSLPAEVVLTERMHDPEGPSPMPLFVP
jgi:hypothetical protein